MLTGESGTSVTALKGDLNWMMSDLDVANGVTNGYQLTEIDLSGFDRPKQKGKTDHE